MADVDDEESSGDEESSSSEAAEEEPGMDEGMNEQPEEDFIEENFEQGIPEEWQPFIDMPMAPKLPVPSFRPENFNSFPENWLDEEEVNYSMWTPILILCLAMFLLWFSYIQG